jgi:5,10-methylenetetrahydromethanopterin reductase
VTDWGLWLHAVRPADQLADLASAAEDLGASAILVADEGTDRDLYVTLTALALRTRRVLLFSAVTNPHTRHPVATAAAFAALAEIAPGRIVAGFGAGGSRVLPPLGLRPARPLTSLIETVDVVDRLLAGEVVEHSGSFEVQGARLNWSPGRLPIALAARGPRAEAFASTRADWLLLTGRTVAGLPALVDRVRAAGVAARRPAPALAWNPTAAWSNEAIAELRSHLAYMAVDFPPAERAELGLDDDLVAHLRETVNMRGAHAAAALLPDHVLAKRAIVGTRPEVVTRLADLTARLHPELLVFSLDRYSVDGIAALATLAADLASVAAPLAAPAP